MASKSIRVAVAQIGSVGFDCDKTIEKIGVWVAKAAKENAQLVVFPEALVPCYPRGLSFGTVVGSRAEKGRELWQKYYENSVDVPGPQTKRLGAMARESNMYMAVGVMERTKGTLYCSILYFGPSGELLGKHRKLKPTGQERVIWGEGDGSTLTTIKTKLGVTVGGLICWENFMPMARMAMYNKGVDIYVAPTADARTTWTPLLQTIAQEGRCFVLGCNQFFTSDMYPEDMPLKEEISDADREAKKVMSCGGSAIIDPFGNILAFNDKEETLLVHDLDLSLIVKGKMDFDVTGHYNRPDVFNFKVNGQPETVVEQ